MLATVLVIIGGAALCCFLAMTATSTELLQGGVVVISLFAVITIVRYRYGRGSSSSLGIFHAIQKNPNDDGLAAQYRPRKVKDKRSELQMGTNQPITAEEAHEIQVSSANTWVPSRSTECEEESQ